jgi:hypothetical protein
MPADSQPPIAESRRPRIHMWVISVTSTSHAWPPTFPTKKEVHMQTHTPSPFAPPQEAVLLSLTRGANRTTACHAAHLPRRTFYNWIEADPAFAEAVEEAEAESIGVAEDLAYACAMKAAEDPRYLRALFFWLKHRAGWVQARPEPTPAPSVRAQHAASAPSAASPVGATGPVVRPSGSVAPSDTVLMDPAPSGDGAPPAENPGDRVPFVPSPTGADAPDTRRGTPLVCPPPDGTPEEPRNRVPSVPSRRQDQLRMQQFRRKHRR